MTWTLKKHLFLGEKCYGKFNVLIERIRINAISSESETGISGSGGTYDCRKDSQKEVVRKHKGNKQNEGLDISNSRISS